ncbi:queuosine precursor transporter, partial [Flavobacteriales bacterium]|nr:queuosine precursor transporter [Flavobacteriales bacterium]
MNEFANRIYLILISIFITSLIVSNLIFQKFFELTILGIKFELSVGILFYPITFLATDLVSEIYGSKKANQMVIMGVFSSLFCLLIVYLANYLNATSWSPVNNQTFKLVFGNTSLAVGASMIAYLCAQFIDIRIYHF